MTITVSLPDEILAGDGKDIARNVLEQVALAGFTSGQLSTAQIRRILGFESRWQVHEFLTTHNIPWVDYDEDELHDELETIKKLVPS